MSQWPLVVAGGGAAGFFAAIFAFKVIGCGDNGVGLPRSKP